MAKNIRLLKLAIFAKLNNDTQLRTLLGGTGRVVASEPKKDAQYPCVVYQIISDRDFPYNENNADSSITQTFFRVIIFSKDSKTEQCDNIEARVKELLHGQRTLDTDEIICYSCFRENMMEPMHDPDLLAWVIPTRYRVAWAVK